MEDQYTSHYESAREPALSSKIRSADPRCCRAYSELRYRRRFGTRDVRKQAVISNALRDADLPKGSRYIQGNSRAFVPSILNGALLLKPITVRPKRRVAGSK